MNVKLSVDGQDGTLVARSTELRDLRTAGDRQLQLYDRSIEYERNGHHGIDAPRSISGSAAGHLSVQIDESPAIKGGIRATVLASQSSHELLSYVDVPVGRDLLLTAIGGNGEDGMNGENGVDGRDGADGADASETSEARPGSDGGYGGNAGHGGNGGDGGNGGTIEILVHEDQVHLLMAVQWDLSGGKGGQPGGHGRPGCGGKGGKGGKEHEWKQRIGYDYICTSRCVGGDTTTNYSSLVRTLEFARTGAQMVTGSNSAQLMVQAAARLQESRSPDANPGACRCHGGQGHCTGCDSRPLTQTHKRVQDLDGLDGRSGIPGTSILQKGSDSLQGNLTIVVQKPDGSRQKYNSLYNLALTDFDVEDENGDGIFEPGEHLFVRRIKVQNSGGMPSPVRPIRLSMVESDWFRPVFGPEGCTFLPSIGEGSSVTVDGPIKVRIREREEYEIPETGALFIRREAIHLNATMPWLEREISNFELSKAVEIRYPCELRNFQALNTVAQGSQSKLSFEVYNHGNVSIGPRGYNSRVVEVDVSFPVDFGELESEPDQWRESVTIIPDDIQSGVGLTLKRQLRVHSHAPSYQHVVATFKLYLGKPNQRGPDGRSDLNLVHVVETRMQVSDHYINHSDASFLLVTNSETGSERAQSIRRYINSSLRMEVDTWNLSLYAGLDYRDQYSGAWENILSRYHGRTIIFLGNQFSFSGQDRKTIFDIRDPEVIATAAANNTNLLFLDTPDFEPHEKLIRESHQFHSVADFVTAVTQQKQYYNISHERYAITLSKKWYRVASLRPAAIAKKVVKQLRRKLPTERFLVTFYEASPLDIIVTTGIPHHNSMAAVEQVAQEQTTDTSASDGLPLTEAYMIVEAITLHHRISLLWDMATRSVSNENSVALHSQLAIEALTTSLIRTTHCELEMMLHKAPWPDTLLPSNPSKHSFEELKTMFASHLPTLHAILFHPQASDPTVAVNDNIQLVLSYALATTRPQLKRQIAAHVLTPTYNRRRRAHTFLRAGISMLLRNKGFTENDLSPSCPVVDYGQLSLSPSFNTSLVVPFDLIRKTFRILDM
ncbi:hypothetical protein F4678DRAFT_467800 [Xylaria arbuscula]|nr:hypothetical protein F4678DRAFT_467800 [Xylaria arbuscula]